MVSRDKPVSLFQALSSFTGSSRSINRENDNKFQKMKKIKLYQNSAKILGIKKLITIPLPSSNHAVSYYQIQKELAWPRRQKKTEQKTIL